MGRREGALDPAAGPVQSFAFELRKLRQEAGGLTYRTMAQRAGYSVATLSRAAAGENLPSLDVALAYVRACGADEAAWEQRWRAVALEASTPEPGDDTQAPYRGLARFEAADAEMFFGRDELVAQLAERVHAHRLVAVVGASGSGKSSLLRAGLIPLLQSETATNRRPAAIRILTPGPRPMSAIATVMRASDERGDTVVVVDQFEELFTLCADPAERRACLDRLLTATNAENKVRVLIAVRADFFGHCADHHAWAAALRGATLLVGPMSPTELRQAIVRPATAAGLIVERDLTARIIKDVTEKPGGLPLMSHALLETWRRRKGRTLTLTAYEAAGGVAGALAQTAEQLYTRLSPHEARSAQHILLRLITPGEGTQDTCRPVSSEELGTDDTEGSTATSEVLERLVKARLVTLDGQTVNLAHEALITAWPRLRLWIDEARERLRVHRQLTEAARTWNDLDHDPGALYRGTRLAAAEEGFAGRRADLIPAERTFLDASIAAREQEQRVAWRTARRFRRLHVAVSAVAVLAMMAGLVAWQRDRTAQQRLADAASRRAAAVAESMRYADPLTALRLSVAAWRISPTLEARAALMGASTQPDQDVFAEPRAAGKDASDPFFLSADGSTLVTGGTGRARLWDLTTRRLLRALPVGGDDRLMEASSDARRLLFRASDAWEVRDAVSGAATRLPLRSSDGVVRFGPDEDTFVVLDNGLRFTKLWHLPRHHHARVAAERTNQQLGTVCTRTGDLLVWGGGRQRRLARRGSWASAVRLACGPRGDALGRYPLHMDEEHLVIVAGNRIHIWSLRTGEEGQSIPASAPTCLSMTADGRFLTVADNRALALWRLGSPARQVFRYSLQGRRVRGASLDPRRKVIRYMEGGYQTGPVIRSLYVGDALDPAWRTDEVRQPPPATDPNYPVESQITAMDAASGDGGRVATGDGTGWVTLWDRSFKHRFGLFDAVPADAADGRPHAVSALAYSPDGRILAAAGGGNVRLWDAATSRPLGTSLLAAGDDVVSLAFNHAGTSLIVHGAHTPPRAYPVSAQQVAASVCARAGSGLSTAAWKTLIPDVSYRRTC
ncbi:helix-turn-helix domain-containing protein [Streptomyces sp. NPDC048191]|uniref:nSTAND1 domain-containing NTPase n=1 Tax=Streptomyces sp. NPDC048191 TaxID=3155484 RepID=UPI0033CA0DAF